MKSIALAQDIFRGEYRLTNRDKRTLLAIISSSKVILENKKRLKFNLNIEWSYASMNVENLIEAIDRIGKETGLYCFEEKECLEVLKELKDSEFDKLISIINASVDSIDILGYCRDLRLTANVEGKMYDNTTQYRVLDIPIKLINPTIENTVVDYFNGESGVEIQLVEHLNIAKDKGSKLQYFGQELSVDSYSIGQLINYLITGNKDRIALGDSLGKPAFVDNGEMEKFDVAISNPPYTGRLNQQYVSDDIYNRFNYGVSEKTNMNGDWIIVNHILSCIKDKGKAAVLLPIGALFRGGAEERVRRSIVSEDLIETIVRIPSTVLSYTNIVTCWVIFNKDKEKKKKNKIQFIDLTDFVESIDRRNNTISLEGVDNATKAHKDFIENEISFILDTQKIADKSYDLNAFDYIKSEKLKKSVDHIEMTEFKNIASIRRGVQVNKGKLDTLNNGSERTHYLISIGNLVNGKIIVNEADKIQIDRKWERVYDVEKGDLLVTSKGTLFKVAIVEENIKAIVSANLFIVRPYQEKYLPEVLKYYLESDLGQNIVQGIIKGTAIKSISHKDIQELEIPVIDIETQKDIVVKINNSVSEYEKRLEEAKKQFDKEQEEIQTILKLSN